MPNRVCRLTARSWLRAISGHKKSANDDRDFHSANFQTYFQTSLRWFGHECDSN